MALASPARSEMIDLTCADPNQTAVTTRLQIDTDRRSVLSTWDGGSNQYKVNALSDQLIKFSDTPRDDNFSEGTIDRIAGTLILNNTNSTGFIFSSTRMTCRRATKKF